MTQIDVKKSLPVGFGGTDSAIPAASSAVSNDHHTGEGATRSSPTGIWVAPADGTFASFSPLSGDFLPLGKLQAKTASNDNDPPAAIMVAPTDGTNMSFAPLNWAMESLGEEDGTTGDKDTESSAYMDPDGSNY